MIRQLRPDGADSDSPRSHRIDAIAHHFLSSVDPPQSSAPSAQFLDVAVAAPDSGRAAACVAAGLAVAGARRHPERWGSSLVEDASVTWSAFSFLGGPAAAPLPAAAAADLPSGTRSGWLYGSKADAGAPAAWLRWRLLGEVPDSALTAWERAPGLPASARSAPPRWTSLVWCVGASAAAAPDGAFRLARLVALLLPPRVEFLVVPDAWAVRPGRPWTAAARNTPGWQNLAHLQEIARSAAGAAAVGVRVLPDSPGAAKGAATSVLGDMVGALCAGREAAEGR